MKKLFAIISASILIMLSLNSYNTLDGKSCNPCEPMPWTGPLLVEMTYQGCDLVLEYEIQECGDPLRCYFRIINFIFKDIDCIDLQNINMDDFFYEASIVIIQEPWDDCIPEGPNGWSEQVQSYTAACWKWDTVAGIGGGQLYLTQCDSNSCCEVHWMLINDQYGNPLPPYKTYSSIANSCEEPLDSACFVICEELE